MCLAWGREVPGQGTEHWTGAECRTSSGCTATEVRPIDAGGSGGRWGAGQPVGWLTIGIDAPGVMNGGRVRAVSGPQGLSGDLQQVLLFPPG
jgi:hypothetical protein